MTEVGRLPAQIGSFCTKLVEIAQPYASMACNWPKSPKIGQSKLGRWRENGAAAPPSHTRTPRTHPLSTKPMQTPSRTWASPVERLFMKIGMSSGITRSPNFATRSPTQRAATRCLRVASQCGSHAGSELEMGANFRRIRDSTLGTLRGSPGSVPRSGARVVRKYAPKWAPEARICTKCGATGDGFAMTRRVPSR